MALGEINSVEFEHDLAPAAEGLGFVENEVEAAANGAPFALEDLPGGVSGRGDFLGCGVAGAPLGAEIGNFVFDKCVLTNRR